MLPIVREVTTLLPTIVQARLSTTDPSVGFNLIPTFQLLDLLVTEQISSKQLIRLHQAAHLLQDLHDYVLYVLIDFLLLLVLFCQSR